MTLPQTLEALLAAGEAAGVDAAGGVDAQWLDRVSPPACLMRRVALRPCWICLGCRGCVQACVPPATGKGTCTESSSGYVGELPAGSDCQGTCRVAVSLSTGKLFVMNVSRASDSNCRQCR